METQNKTRNFVGKSRFIVPCLASWRLSGENLNILEIFNDRPGRPRFKVTGLFLLLGAFNLGAWAWAWTAFRHSPALLATALLAYLFGLRHALDADHLAAIDNVVRKLSQKGGRPYSTGFFFSLGHSTVVVLASVLVAGAAAVLKGRLEKAGEIGGMVGTAISAFFLLFIAFANFFILRAVWAAFQKARRGEAVDEEDLNALLSGRGFFTRMLKSLFDLVSESRHLYWIGFLFGLGFDTATEVGLLGLSATQAVNGLSPSSLLIFPALFTGGMALVDTADSVLMVEVYGWAFRAPLRKLWYNLTLTSFSILLALVIGGAEALSLVSGRLGLTGGIWDAVAWMGNLSGGFGLTAVGIFLLGWAVSALWYRWAGYEERQWNR
jgi:nickel/cobalt transporter (NiCoT) family protein